MVCSDRRPCMERKKDTFLASFHTLYCFHVVNGKKCYLNLAINKFGVFATYRRCAAPESQTYNYTSRLR